MKLTLHGQTLTAVANTTVFPLQVRCARRWSAPAGTVVTAAGVVWWAASMSVSAPMVTLVISVRDGYARGGGSLRNLTTNKDVAVVMVSSKERETAAA